MKNFLFAVALLSLFFSKGVFAQNNSLNFDGSYDCVDIPASTAWAFGTGDFTVEWWQYQTDSNPYPRIFSLNQNDFAVSIEGGTIYCWIGGFNVSVSAGVYKNRWVHFAVSRSAGTVKIYKNGELLKTGTNTGNISNTTSLLIIGRDAGTLGFGGNLEELRFWNVARSQSDIQNNIFTSLVGNESGLIAYYKFNQGTAGGSNSGITTLNDETSNNHDGTLISFALTGNTSNWVGSISAPNVQATNITSVIYSTSLNLSWTNGNGTHRTVFVTTAETGSAAPADGTTYNANTVFGLGDEIGTTDWFCVYNGSGSTVNVSGLTQTTTYRIMVCEYNNAFGDIIYYTATAANNPANIPTVEPAVEPETQASQLLLAINGTGLNLSWQNGNGVSRAVFLKATNSGTPVPVNNTVYTANTIFGSGSQIGSTGWYCVYNGTGNSVNVTNISTSTEYRAMVCEYNTEGSTIFYYNSNSALNNPNNFTTPANSFTWTAFGTGANSIVNAIAVNGIDVYAGGYFSSIGGVSANFIAKWNGSIWSALGSGPSDQVNAITINGSNLYVVGTNPGGPFVKKWNGTSWSTLATGSMFDNIAAIAIYEDTVYVGGNFTSIGGVSANRIAKWNGSSWSAFGTGANNTVSTITVDGGNVFIGGSFTTIDGVSANRIAKWNGSSWSAFGTGANNTVSTITVDGGNVFIGGSFTTIDGVSANRIAKWNGSIWSALGDGANGNVSAIAIHGSIVYAGGSFTTIGGVSANYLAKWNGSGWVPIGLSWCNGVNNTVSSIKLYPEAGKIIIGGSFSSVYGVSNGAYIANFADPDDPFPVELTTFSGSVSGSSVELNWQTATETNNYGFEVEKTSPLPSPYEGEGGEAGRGWEKIGFVNGSGNSNSPKDYTFVDDFAGKPAYGIGRYSYRLKQIDNDGQFEYSETIEVDLDAPKKFELSQNYPNPFNPSTTIRFSLPEAGNVKLILFNILGQEIKTLVNEVKEAGTHSINFNASELNSGVYIYKIESGSFTQTKKMTLIK